MTTDVTGRSTYSDAPLISKRFFGNALRHIGALTEDEIKNAIKTVLAAAVATATIAFPLQSVAHGEDGGSRREWKQHGHRHHHHRQHHWQRHRGRDVVVIDEPRYVYRDSTHVYREPSYVLETRRPGVLIGVELPHVLIPF